MSDYTELHNLLERLKAARLTEEERRVISDVTALAHREAMDVVQDLEHEVRKAIAAVTRPSEMVTPSP